MRYFYFQTSLQVLGIAVIALARPTEYAIGSTGCGKALPAGLTQGGTGMSNNITFTQSNGNIRNYLLHIPVNYDIAEARGIVWSYHGRNRTSVQQERLTQFSNPELNPDMIVVYPQGSYGIDGVFAWQGDPKSLADDISFTLELLDSLANTYCIDTDRVYMSGLSNGGGFGIDVCGCDPVCSTKFAAYASASGAFYQEIGPPASTPCETNSVFIPCNPGRTPIPIVETHGGKDHTIPYPGGHRRRACLPSVPYYMTSWAERNGFSATNETTMLHDGNVFHYLFGDGDNYGTVQSYYVPSLHHAWPSTVENEENHNPEPTYFNATQIFVDFFSQHSLPH